MASLMGSLLLAKPGGVQVPSSVKLQSLETGAHRFTSHCVVSSPKHWRKCARDSVVVAVATTPEVSSNGSATSTAPVEAAPSYGRQFFPLAAVVGQVRGNGPGLRSFEWVLVPVRNVDNFTRFRAISYS